MSTFPNSPRLLKGALVAIDPLRPMPTVIVFQYLSLIHISPGSLSFSIPYEYRVPPDPFHAITTVAQVHTLAADASTLTSSKAGANGTTTVAAATVVQPQCP